MNLQTVFAIINEAQLSEPVHEKTNPGPGRSYHVREGFLTDLRYHSLGGTFLAEVGKQEQNSCQSLFAGIKKLVN